jgi:plastocyanin
MLSTSSCAGADQHEIQLHEINFQPSSITIHKGESITLVDDSPEVHVIENGSWVDGMQRPHLEQGALKVDAYMTTNQSKTLGPFTMAGTFHLYCSVHADMNLTIIVH